MLLKKQTVWLLTMLSLVVVLSVYYITSPEGGSDNMVLGEKSKEEQKLDGQKAATDKNAESTKDTSPGKETAGKEQAEVEVEEMEDGTVISSVSSDELFETLRLQLNDERSKLTSELRDMVASKEVSAEEKAKAMDKMEELSEAAAREAVIETLIKSKGYEDALVRADGNNVRITVKAKKHTASSANDIIHIVKSEFNELENVAVTFQPSK